MIIDDNIFIEKLSRQYEASLDSGFPPNEPLKNIWRQLSSSFTTALTSPINNKIQVLNPPTGSGKTHCLAEWCKHYISNDSEDSILIAVRTTAQADELMRHINKDTSQRVAIASHSELEEPISYEEVQNTPILIITAEAYRLLLVERSGDSMVDLRYKFLLGYRSGLRKLTVIDEEFSFAEAWASNLERLKQGKAYIPKNISDKYPLELAFLSKVIGHLEDTTKLEKIHFNKDKVDYDFGALMLDMRSEQVDSKILGDGHTATQRKPSQCVRETLDLLSRISKGFALVQRKGDRVIEIGTSISLLPEQLDTNIIILDATAKSNPSYPLIASRVDLVGFKGAVRDYSNLCIHFSVGHTVGKHQLYAKRKEAIKYLSANIKNNLGENDSLLLIHHKKLKKEIERLMELPPQIQVVNWGNITGKNDWKDCENAIIFGLPYRSLYSCVLDYFALKGEQSNVWLQSSSGKPSGRTRSLEKIKKGYTVSDIIQAMNRCQIRKSVNTQGLCPKTDIYILLRSENEANFILNEMKSQMPNMKTTSWLYNDSLNTRNITKNLDNILKYCKEHKGNRKIILKDIAQDLGINERTFRNIKATLASSESRFSRGLDDLKLVYRYTGQSRNLQQWLEPKSLSSNNNSNIGDNLYV